MNLNDLITCVFSKTAIWDSTHPNHHNKYILDDLWDTVAQNMNSTPEAVKAKWKILRDSFRKEFKKVSMRKSLNGSCSTFRSNWRYFYSLYFLKKNINLTTCKEKNEHTSDKVTEAVLMDDSVNDVLLYPFDDTDNCSLDMSTSTNIKNKLSDKSSKSVYPDEDEDWNFFKSLLPHVRPLQPQCKMSLRIQIQGLVYNYAYGDKPDRGKDDPDTSQKPQLSTNFNDCTEIIELHSILQEYSNPLSAVSHKSTVSEEKVIVP